MRKLEEPKDDISLSAVPTYRLVEALKTREGVEAKMVEPYVEDTTTVEGPAVVLIVTD